jgi:hypothetical protein
MNLNLLLWLLFNQCILAHNDCYWLMIIYREMGGNAEGITQDCCTMDGVRCIDGHVTHIDWSNRGLIGTVPSEIGNLVNLKKL